MKVSSGVPVPSAQRPSGRGRVFPVPDPEAARSPEGWRVSMAEAAKGSVAADKAASVCCSLRRFAKMMATPGERVIVRQEWIDGERWFRVFITKKGVER